MIQKIKEWAGVVAAIAAIALLAVVLVGGNQSVPSFGRVIPGYTTFDAVGTAQLAVGTGCNDALGSSCAGVIISTAGALSASSSIDVLGTITQGGGIRATSTSNSAETLLVTDFDTENVIDYTLNVQAATLTLPASSTLSSFIPTAGQMRTVWIRNATTTATNLTIAGGTGTILKQATSTDFAGSKIIFGDTDGDNRARLDFVRKTNSDIDVYMTAFRD